jgi:hypothetical protein
VKGRRLVNGKPYPFFGGNRDFDFGNRRVQVLIMPYRVFCQRNKSSSRSPPFHTSKTRYPYDIKILDERLLLEQRYLRGGFQIVQLFSFAFPVQRVKRHLHRRKQSNEYFVGSNCHFSNSLVVLPSIPVNVVHSDSLP